MSRRPLVVAALGMLTATTIVATHADAAPRRAGTDARAATSSVALFGAADGGFQAATGVTGTQPQATGFFLADGSAVAAAVNPARGKDGLVCTDRARLLSAHGLRSTPTLDKPAIDATAYADEGSAGRTFQCDGLAVHGTFALAGGASQGLLQLVRQDGAWQVDRRVRSRGTNDAVPPRAHRRGWINVRSSVTHATSFTGVAIAPRPLANGRFLAVTVDREAGTLVVVSGVGTAKPRIVGSLHADALDLGERGFGNGGMAFLPSSRDRAVIATRSGFAVLDLRRPDRPRLRVKTRIAVAAIAPTTLTVSSDRDHLAVSAGAKVYGYRNVLAAVKHGKPFRRQTSFRLSNTPSERVSDVAYTDNDRLVVLHGDTLVPTDWSLTLVTQVPRGRHAVQGSMPTSMPGASGTLSVWPAP